MPAEYSFEIRERAEELYILDGLIFEEVAARTGVSESQLKRWALAATPPWTVRRREYRQAQTSVRFSVMLAKSKLIQGVLDTQDPQKAYAFSSLCSSGRLLEQAAKEPVQPAGPQRTIETAQDAVTAMAEALQSKVNNVLATPGGLNFAAINDLQKTMALIEQLTAKYLGDAKKATRQGLSDDTVREIREQILGIGQ